jgi:hypothetical protein
MACLTEDNDMMDQLFDDKDFSTAYKKIENNIDIIYFTDRQTYTREQHALYLSFDLNTSSRNLDETFRDITSFVHILIDQLCNVRVSSQVLII